MQAQGKKLQSDLREAKIEVTAHASGICLGHGYYGDDDPIDVNTLTKVPINPCQVRSFCVQLQTEFKKLLASNKIRTCTGSQQCTECHFHLLRNLRIARSAEQVAAEQIEKLDMERLKAISDFDDLKRQMSVEAFTKKDTPTIEFPAPLTGVTEPVRVAERPKAPAVPGPVKTIGAPASKPAVLGWNNFHEAIRQDDAAMIIRAHDEFERLGGATFRPEIRETYTDQQGKKHETFHAKTGGVQESDSDATSASASDSDSGESSSSSVDIILESKYANCKHAPY